MSLYGTMITSASGMQAQADRLGTVADNISNSSTTGYKNSSAEFSSMVLESKDSLQFGGSQYTSGMVQTHVRHAVSRQGTFDYTTSATDLAVNGPGFFVVSGPAGQTFLTRAGAFVKDSNGDLVNSAGFKLMGYRLAGGAASGVANGTGGLQTVNIGTLALEASASTKGALAVNLPSNAGTVASANLPSANAASAQYTAKTSLVAYDNLGNQVTLDCYASKTAANTWEIAVFDQSKAASGGGFPYSSGPLTTTTLTFDAASGKLASSSPTTLSIAVPNGATLKIDLAQTSQLATDFSVQSAIVNGNAPSTIDHVEISDTGVLSAVYKNGAKVPTYQIPLANVVSPDNLQPMAGTVFATTANSGAVQIATPGSPTQGSIVSSALEKSTVDVASELTSMIEAQRTYSANSKVFQTSTELLDVLVNLAR